MDQLRRARECADGPPERGRGMCRGSPPSALGRATVSGGRAEARLPLPAGRVAGAVDAAVSEVVSARRFRLRDRDSKDKRWKIQEVGPPRPVPRLLHGRGRTSNGGGHGAVRLTADALERLTCRVLFTLES